MKVFLVEDHPIFRRGLCDLLEEEEDLEVCGEAEDVGTALEAIGRTQPDVVLVDISLKGRNGLELVKILHGSDPGLPILMISTHEENLYAERSLRAGARGYVMKHETADSIVSAVREVVAGRVWVSPRVASTLLARTVGEAVAPTGPPEERLSDRELEVLALFGQGLTTKEVSDRLSLSHKTIGTYRERLKEKLGLRNSAELLRHAVRWLEQRGGR
ncbi:MAG TPA: response regulator transcription factor [Deferrisomatales bacterium]|nr:response regulator transcription factor [Deferrisomatales bacterium]